MVAAPCAALLALAACSAGSISGDANEVKGKSEGGARLVCGAPRLDVLPEGTELVDRELVSLGAQTMGRVETYRGEGHGLVAYVGIDPLSVLEDLDLTTEEVVVGRRTVGLGHSPLVPGLAVAKWSEPGQEALCALIGLVTTGLSDNEIRETIEALVMAEPRST